MRVLTGEQMRLADAAGVARVGEDALMQRAGVELARAIEALLLAQLSGADGNGESSNERGPLVAFAGPGNNGGDAFAAFAALDTDRPCIVYAMDVPSKSGARREAERRAAARGVETRAFPATQDEAATALADASLALDALLGTGARPAPSDAMLPAIRALNALPPERVLTVDLPTGVDATTGTVPTEAVRAGTTVTIGAPKLGLLLEPARPYTGALYVADIGLGADCAVLAAPYCQVLAAGEFLALLPHRAADSDKRASGAPLIVAGSAQFPGAAVLSSLGAARAGAGYVTLATPTDAVAACRMHLIEQVVVPFDERSPDNAASDLLALTPRCNAVGLGPGLGLSDNLTTFVTHFLEHVEVPFVVDASGLFHLAKHLDILRGKACVLTPHAGEFARLSGKGNVPLEQRISRLREFTTRTGVTTLLKGEATLIDDGTTLHINPTGTNALATAGTGDVLTGIIATLLSQGLSPVDAARVGAYWHGLAGQTAHEARPVGVIARDLPEVLAAALRFTPKSLGGLTRLY